jgi:hypothetical protein
MFRRARDNEFNFSRSIRDLGIFTQFEYAAFWNDN